MCNYYCLRNLTDLYLLVLVLFTLCLHNVPVNSLNNANGTSNTTGNVTKDLAEIFRPTSVSKTHSSETETANPVSLKSNLSTIIVDSSIVPQVSIGNSASQTHLTVSTPLEGGGDSVNSLQQNSEKPVSEPTPLEGISDSVNSVQQNSAKPVSEPSETKAVPLSLQDFEIDVPEAKYHQTSGRKGVDYNQGSNKSTEKNLDNNSDKSCVCHDSSVTSLQQNCIIYCNSTVDMIHPRNNSILTPLKDVTADENSIVFQSKNISTEIPKLLGKIENESLLHSPSPKKKSKPTFTVDETSTNLPIQLTYISSPESNYIIPIVAVILAAPLVIALAMFLYNKGKEFWERRHYRRMDFLIDGMYND